MGQYTPHRCFHAKEISDRDNCLCTKDINGRTGPAPCLVSFINDDFQSNFNINIITFQLKFVLFELVASDRRTT